MASHPHQLRSTRAITPSPIGAHPPRVLLIEGCHSFRGAMAVAVARAGCLPIEATCAEEGWILALSGAVDLVMVSQSLPNMSGAELIGLLRGSQDERLRQVPVIGLARHELCEHSLASVGVTCFVRSPYCEADVMRAIRWVAEVYWTDTDADASRSNA